MAGSGFLKVCVASLICPHKVTTTIHSGTFMNPTPGISLPRRDFSTKSGTESLHGLRQSSSSSLQATQRIGVQTMVS